RTMRQTVSRGVHAGGAFIPVGGLACLLAFSLVSVGRAADEAAFGRDVRSTLAAHCQQCHDSDGASGGIEFESLTSPDVAMSRYRMWKKVVEQVSTGTMPPEGETPLTADEKQRLLAWVENAFDTSQHPDPGPPLVRQLTREEYSQTMRDLLKFWHDSAGQAGIPHESVVDGFANRAGGQVLESSLMERYFTAADISLDKLFLEGNTGGPRRDIGISGDVAELAAAWQKHLSAPDQVEAQPELPSSEALPHLAARQVLHKFMRRAFRRPVSDDEVERYARIADTALDSGDDFAASLRKAMKPVLVSPHFLLRVERNPVESGSVARVSDHELAVRLSYFLWGSMPDDELFAVADQGSLSQPELLEQQVRRMLAHHKGEALTRHFLTKWLQLPQLHKSLPQQNVFPTFTRSLRDSMERETWMFCDNLRKEDRSILDLLDADYTFVNEELGRHYGITDLPSKDFAKVALRPEHHRGGLPGMASMLTMTSHTDRTKPTARGKWILEVLLGSPPPPPPANAGSFSPPDKDRPEPESFREKLGQHASNPNCVACHLRIDPLGFALENYNAIGAWRDDVGGKAIDNKGMLPGIGEFQGVDGLRHVLKSKQPKFVRNLVEQTLSYALGRDVSYYDEPTIDAIIAAMEEDDYRFSRLILEVTKSFPFQHRRGIVDSSE
ncbi:MAG: mono/diheme cytochrome c family protein, partial [Planctomycetaceae bacterium]